MLDDSTPHPPKLEEERPQRASNKQKKSPVLDQSTTIPPSSLRASVPTDEVSTEDTESIGAVVTIRVGRLRCLESSSLLSPHYHGSQVFVEWNFLDFARDECETPGTRPLPRSFAEIVNFETLRDYDLSRKRVALLKQWVETSNRLNFTLVLDPGEDDSKDFDDLCVGELNLAEVVDTDQHYLTSEFPAK